MKFEGKVAFITGGASGMGKAAAIGFAKEGATIVINDKSEENLKIAAAEIQAFGGQVMTVQGDVTSNAEVQTMFAKVYAKLGKVDILYNYVGGNPDMTPFGPFTGQNETFWRKSLELNILSTLFCTRAVLDDMIQRRYGKIINTAAAAGRIGAPNMVIYSTSKGGIIAFTKALSQEVYQYNINVNCISPGPTLTPGFRKMFGVQTEEEFSRVTEGRLGRIGTPEEVASAAIYLASDEAGYISGQTIAVDGGFTLV